MSASNKHLLVHGLVQGVFYRKSMIEQARRLGLAGWVRNRHAGQVEAMVGGDAAAVEALVEWARRGPEHARVEHVAVRDVAGGEPLPVLFEQRETA